MKKDIIEFLDFEENEKYKVGRPKLVDKKTKKNSIIIASVSFLIVIVLLIFGYGTLVGFKNIRLFGNLSESSNLSSSEKILIDEIKPISKNITIKENTIRKVYLTVLPNEATNKKISYSSSDESIVRVDGQGKVYGVSIGKAVVTATTTDGSDLSINFNITVIKDASGKCEFLHLSKTSKGVDYEIECDNAKLKEIQVKTNGDYKSLVSKKLVGSVDLSSRELKNKITFKLVYYPNNSKITKYITKSINQATTANNNITGSCELVIKEINSNSCKYDITCKNATVDKIAYKIGNGSYVGIDTSNLADTIIFEESDVTRVLYLNVEYTIDGTSKVKTITKNSVINKKSSVNAIDDETIEEEY